MTSKCIVVDVNDLENYEKSVDEIGSSPSRPPPSSLSLKCKANQSTNESEVQAKFNTNITKTQSKKSRRNTSNVWPFKKKKKKKNQGIGNDSKPYAKYKGCGEVYMADCNKYGTSSLSHYVGKCLSIKAMY